MIQHRLRFSGLCLLVLIGACSAPDRSILIEAGPHGRYAAPVFIDLNSSAIPATQQVYIATEGGIEPTQIEPLDDGRSRLWWIVSDLPAGQSRRAVIRFAKTASWEKDEQFAWKDSSADREKSRELLLGDRPVLRYVYTPFDPQDIENTKKPYHHVFDPTGQKLITKGLGGLYPHHRGIYFGYNKCRIGDEVYDTWHAAKGEHEQHVEFVREFAGPVFGGHVVRIHWNDRAGKPFIEETRRVLAFRQPAGQVLIEFSTMLRALNEPVDLGGDRQHAGVQFRAAQTVAENQKATRYLRPERWAALATDKEYNDPDFKDLPWNALQYPLDEHMYTVAYLSDPANPEPAEFSERLYGRFGEFIPWKLDKDHPLSLRYRWWITTNPVIREQIERAYQDLADPPKVVQQ